ncbi:DNA polymerase delta catalytic subunit [Cryptosporidium ryanae]|uniref:DNA polymerase delta catalytic subunit n=1 Tax=Cryptosporidium ryanae TaxID=515981 RepID=UPI00351A0F22|nr:DNA polymerase delta catalytic subunit [Cryptosporidium ryanae]
MNVENDMERFGGVKTQIGFKSNNRLESENDFGKCLDMWRRAPVKIGNKDVKRDESGGLADKSGSKVSGETGIVPKDGSIEFCILDVRFSTGRYPNISDQNLEFVEKYDLNSYGTFRGELLGRSNNNGSCMEIPIIQLFGSTKTGVTVLANVHGFFPYLYCEAPKSINPNPDAIRSQIEKNSGMSSTNSNSGASSASHDPKVRVLNVKVVKKESIMHYRADQYANKDINEEEKGSRFYKITLQLPNHVPTCRNMIENGNLDCLPTAYEANIPFVLRFLVDLGISTGSWIGIKGENIRLRDTLSGLGNGSDKNVNFRDELGIYRKSQYGRVSTCQIEVDIFYDELNILGTEGMWSGLPPIRILSYDIECVTESGTGFPEPQKDPVIQISSIMTLLDSEDPIFKVVFALKECASIADSFVFWFESEREMLLAWRNFFVTVDPDVVTGYNCISFDMHYLLERAKVFQLNEFSQLSRIINNKTQSKDTRFSSRAFGTHDSKQINIEGRILWDLLETIRREHKLKSYSLNYVSTHFLKEQKEDVHYSMIRGLQDGNPETRKRVAVYCLKDSLLPLRLMKHLKLFPNIIEMARVTGTTIDILLNRGQQIKVTSQILRKCGKLNFLMPTVKNYQDNDNQFEGATVLEPCKGFYKDPVSTLDFASLYPSIMIAHNICYSTLIPPSCVKYVPESERVTSPTGHSFVNPSVRKGILPQIVEELISARKKAKKDMLETTDPILLSILDGRQLALKISANSVYGYTGTITGGQLPCLELSTSITSFGRFMIDATKNEVEKMYTKENGYPADAKVIYGDTDSVMIQFGVSDIAEAMRLGLEAATNVSKLFVQPIKLEFEKVYCPFLLMNKKRYAGVLYKRPEVHDKIDCKGIETVRRDNCILVQKVVDSVLKKILIDKDVEGAKQYTRNVISDLLKNKIDLSLLVVSKSLGKDDYTAKLPHVELAKRLRIRDPGSAPNIGDRVSYVVIRGAKGQPQYDRAEDPLYVLEKNIAIDTQHYVDTLKSSLVRVFEGIMKDPEKLFTGSHTRSVTVLSSTGGALSGFVKKGLQCLGCKTTINNENASLCKDCIKVDNKECSVLINKLHEFREKEIEYNSLWTQCQRCQGSAFQDIICTSRDCPIFYRRTKVRKDISSIGEQIERLCVDW